MSLQCCPFKAELYRNTNHFMWVVYQRHPLGRKRHPLGVKRSRWAQTEEQAIYSTYSTGTINSTSITRLPEPEDFMPAPELLKVKRPSVNPTNNQQTTTST
ncbi:hypothetical protein QYF36_022856 [Acer negundo]|nr:hypothetical protein QYF36_022856 [Acer negundo]